MLINHNCNLKLYSYFYSYIFGSLTFHMYIFYCISFPVLLVPPLTIYPPTVFCFFSNYISISSPILFVCTRTDTHLFCFFSYNTVFLFPPLFYSCVPLTDPHLFCFYSYFYIRPYSICVFPRPWSVSNMFLFLILVLLCVCVGRSPFWGLISFLVTGATMLGSLLHCTKNNQKFPR